MNAFDYLIIGSGAGGAAAAYRLAQSGARVLILEKGEMLPRDGSTLDPARVLRAGAFLSREPWVDRQGRTLYPEEHFNVGGKTKWYGAALLRFDPHELEADPAHHCLAWPFGYAEIAPYYAEAERLLEVRQFPLEPDFSRITAGLVRQDGAWRSVGLAVGLAADLLDDTEEARHFDGFASVRGLKSDAERCLLDRIRDRPNVAMLTGKDVTALLPAPSDPRRLAGVVCADGSRYAADRILLAAGALHSPRLLQHYLADSGLEQHLSAASQVGRFYKCHLLTALLAFGRRTVRDLLCKTALLLHEAMPHSSVQTLGGSLAEEIVRAQAPAFVPGGLVAPVARRAYGFFLQTEDGSHPDNRVIVGKDGTPCLDQDLERLPEARAEHRLLVRTLSRQLLSLGYLPVAKAIGLSGTAHACGTLVTGSDPQRSVVDPFGLAHGLHNLYVVDGSVLPRSSRVNPALTIYAWALRVADKLATVPVPQDRMEAAA
jgi:choline dehydrogenase-like flavoprotein